MKKTASPRHSNTRQFETEFGYFSADGREYIIKRPDTPRPWVNVICPGDYGVVVSQTGSGYSWRTHASLNRITRWNQDLIVDEWGKYLYVRDEDTGKFWSATWKPVCQNPTFYECRHGIGYSTIISRNADIQTELRVFVPVKDPTEIWELKVTNLSSRTRHLSAWSYFEWNLGEGPDSHREFHKTFIETDLDAAKRLMLAKKRLWTICNAKGQHWNRSWEYVAWHSVNARLRDLSGSKDAFIGQYGNVQHPRALKEGRYLAKTTGKWDDGIASLCCGLKLRAGESKTLIWTLGAAKSSGEAHSLAKKYQSPQNVARAFDATRTFWDRYLDASEVQTPDAAFNLLSNRWLKYQAVSGRIFGRTGYYQSGGAFGYRDQLQDSQIFLHLETERTKRQIHLHAEHQFTDGIVQHWWHAITNEGPRSQYSDDFLWLPYVAGFYLKETGDYRMLTEKAPYLPEKGKKPNSGTIYEHCWKAIEYSLARRDARGLPIIGTGDWNDGLSVAGWEGKGVSVWVAQFLYGIIQEFARGVEEAIRRGVLSSSERRRIKRYQKEARKLYDVVNRHGWDGEWYWAASCDDGSRIGSRRSKECKIHLNPQTWAVMNRMVPAQRLPKVLKAVERYLYRQYGPLVLYPAYKKVDDRVGYLTRYAPGVRENGGLYTHAGTWAIQMECFLQRPEKAWKLFKSFCPIDRGMAPRLYQCEPYVTPGNVDGPDSPLFGRGGWTWYTGSAAWLYRIMTEWIIGIRPEWEGLKIAPCVPKQWKEFTAKRVYRGVTYRVHFHRNSKLQPGHVRVSVEGRDVPNGIIPPSHAGKGTQRVQVQFN